MSRLVYLEEWAARPRPARHPNNAMPQSKADKRNVQGILTERRFLPLVETKSQELWLLANTLIESSSESWPRAHLFQLLRGADELEAFLDDFGARENRAFHTYRELCAAIRWIGLALYSLGQPLLRLDRITLPSKESQERATADLTAATVFLQQALLKTLRRFRDEVKNLDLQWPEGEYPEEMLPKSLTRQRLPRDLAEERSGAEPASKTAQFVARLLGLHERMARLPLRERTEASAIHQAMADWSTEENARLHEAKMHNLQSQYDTHLEGTADESDELKLLREVVGCALGLLEATTALSHFYERHQRLDRRGPARRLLESLVDRDRVADIAVNVCSHYSFVLLCSVEGLAQEILEASTRQVVASLPVAKGIALHARPASLIVSIVNHHGTPVEMEIDGHRCNAASMMQVLVLAGSHREAAEVLFRGDERPLNDLRCLFENNLGESGLETLPAQLSYLRPTAA